MNIIGWKTYYGDGSIFTSIDGGWKESPQDDVQAVTIFYDEQYKFFDSESQEFKTQSYRKMIHSFDYYWLEKKEPKGGNEKESYNNADEGTVKNGTQLTKELWREVYDKARSDVEWK